jgi:predicted GNAT family acetyltransferase
MKIDLDKVDVYVNHSANRIEARVEEYLCLIDFIPAGRVIVFTHTEVPSVLSGNGIAAKMVQLALAFAEESHLKVIPQCPYVSGYLRRHPERQPQVYTWSPKSRRAKQDN